MGSVRGERIGRGVRSDVGDDRRLPRSVDPRRTSPWSSLGPVGAARSASPGHGSCGTWSSTILTTAARSRRSWAATGPCPELW